MPNFERKFKCPGVPFTPLITLIACIALLITLRTITWIGFLVWLCIGLVVYFTYGMHHSALQQNQNKEAEKNLKES